MNTIGDIKLKNMVEDVDRKGITQDSRGVKLDVHDVVLYTYKNVNYFQLGTVYEDKFKELNISGIESSRSENISGSGYVIRVTEAYKQHKDDLIKFLNHYDYSLQQFYILLGVKEKLWKQDNNKDTTLGMPIMEYFGRSYKAGDFGIVVYNNDIMYGIVLSKTHMLLENGQKVRIKHFLLLEDKLTKEEVASRQNLTEQYRLSIQKEVSIEREARIGDIYINKSNLYLYLGRIHLKAYCQAPCSTLCNIDYVSLEPVWFVIKFTGKKKSLNELLECKLEQLFIAEMEDTLKCVDKRFKASDVLWLDYKEIVKFACFSDKVGKSLKYLNTINFYENPITLQSNVIKSQLRHHIFKLKLLDL